MLRLLQKPELALKIYDRGLTKVKIGTDNDRTVSLPTANLMSDANDLEIASGI